MLSNLFNTIRDNLIAGDAYYAIAKAVIVTIITVILAWGFAYGAGSVLSYFMCYEKKAVSAICRGICFLLRGTPCLLLLLLFYYVFFRSLHINTVIVAGVAIGLYGAGHFAEILSRSVRRAQELQDPAVTERLKHMFFRVCIPQGMEDTMFQMKRLAVQLLQWTTVVGYVSVNDLTEVMHGIGQRTMYPFFSVGCCCIFYLLCTLVIELLFRMASQKMDKKS